MIELPALKEKRLRHCRSVAALSYELAKALGEDPVKAEIAGYLHDVARGLPKDKMLSLSKELGIYVGPEEEKEPLLLHGPLAAEAGKVNYGITDGDIYEAIFYHTVGHEKMSRLARIVFFADKTEPLRQYDGCAGLREKGFTDFDGAFKLAVSNEMAYCKVQGYPVHPGTIALYRSL